MGPKLCQWGVDLYEYTLARRTLINLYEYTLMCEYLVVILGKRIRPIRLSNQAYWNDDMI